MRVLNLFSHLFVLQEGSFVQTWWLTGKDGYNFNLKLDVCVFVPKKVKLDRVIVKRDKTAKPKKAKKEAS